MSSETFIFNCMNLEEGGKKKQPEEGSRGVNISNCRLKNRKTFCFWFRKGCLQSVAYFDCLAGTRLLSCNYSTAFQLNQPKNLGVPPCARKLLQLRVGMESHHLFRFCSQLRFLILSRFLRTLSVKCSRTNGKQRRNMRCE